jgi:hypothetical protein
MRTLTVKKGQIAMSSNLKSNLLSVLGVLLLSMPLLSQAQNDVKAPYEITIENSRFAGIYDSPDAVLVSLKMKNNRRPEPRTALKWELHRLPSGEILTKDEVILASTPGESAWTLLPFPKKAGYGLYEYTACSTDGKIKAESARVSIMREPPRDREMDNLGFNIHVVSEGSAMTLRRLGVRWARIDFNWSFTTSREGIPWDFFDKQVSIGELYGLKLLPNLCYVPKWAEKPDKFFDPKDHADYVSKILTRYKGKLPAFQIWNEPPESMNKIWLDDAKAIFKAARAADPKCKIAGFAFAANPGEPGGFFTLLTPPISVGRYLDIFDWNNYPAPRNRRPEETSKVSSVEYLKTSVPEIRSLVAGHEVWITEHGFSMCDLEHNYEIPVIGPLSVTEKQQGDYLVRQLMLEYAYGIDRVFIYQLGPDGTAGDWEAQLGITRGRSNGLSAKIAYVQIGNMVQEIAGAIPAGVEKPAPDYRVVRFRRGSTEVVAVWKIRGSGKLTFRINSGYVSDPFGNRTPRNETAAFAISESPVFLVGKKVDLVGSAD